MRKLFTVVILLSIVQVSFSQEEKKQFIHKGLLRAMATISPGILLDPVLTAIYLHGNFEYYIADNISVRGDGYYNLTIEVPTQNKLSLYYSDPYPYLNSNHQIFSGASFHIPTKNHFDLYICFQPGMAISQSIIGQYPTNEYICSNTSVNPLISSVLGFNFYFERWFHLFSETRYVIGKHLSNSYEPASLNELRFSFGLGFNLSVFKPKITPATSN